MNVAVKNGDPLGAALQSRLRSFESSVLTASKASAAIATATSQGAVKAIRPGAPPRANRYSGLRDALRWRPIGDGDIVGLALTELNQKFPVWLVQEIGTGERAVQHVAGKPNPSGRPAKDATYIKTVRSQRGRRISGALVFADRGGNFSPPGAAHGQQLHLRSQVKGAPVRFDRTTNRRAANIVIEREIKGQHFVKKGGQAGFREYRESVLAAARTQLKKKA